MSQRSSVEEALCYAIIKGLTAPINSAYNEGRKDRKCNIGFHECKYAPQTPEALSWRIGWNAEALEQRKNEDQYP